jgi:hypothetical protein
MDALTFFSNLYPEVHLYAGFKVLSLNGFEYHNGLTFKRIMRSSDLIMNYQRQQEETYKVLVQNYGNEFARWVGRPMVVSDIRLAVKPAQEKQIAVFLDDVTESVGAHLMVETSPGNFHAHFVVDRFCNDWEIIRIQKVLNRFFNGDRRAVRRRQARRLPVPGLRTKINTDLPLINAERLLLLSKFYFPEMEAEIPVTTQLVQKSQNNDGTNESCTEHEGGAVLPDSAIRDIWFRKWMRHHKDDSAADFGLATYLIEKQGYSVSAVIDAIRLARDNLVQEKGMGAEQYLRHTAEKAASVVEQRRVK